MKPGCHNALTVASAHRISVTIWGSGGTYLAVTPTLLADIGLPDSMIPNQHRHGSVP
jgi:hypothetical protein